MSETTISTSSSSALISPTSGSALIPSTSDSKLKTSGSTTSTTSTNSSPIISSSTLMTSASPTSTDSSITTSSTTGPGTVSGLGNSIASGNSTTTGIPHTHHGSTVSGGAVAGIAIGTFILGALLALIGFWLFSRRRNPPPRPKSSSNGYSKSISAGNSVAVSKDPETPMQDYSIVERADDSQLRYQMQNLGELIYQHVENHYVMKPYNGKAQDFIARLTKCGYTERTEPTAFTLGYLLINPTERRTAIKSLIGWVILRAVELNYVSEYSLLPDEITSFYRTISKGERRLNEQDAFGKSLSRWRQLSAHLLSSIHSPQEPSITKVVDLLNSVLQPFIKPNSSNSQSQADNLASLVKDGREFGLLLLAQPGTWVFGWETSTGTGPNATNQIVAFPSLEELITRGKKERRRVVCEQDREKT